jgi:hypothetical protein
MSAVVNPLARRGRAGFGSLTAGMVLRGSVPAQVLYASAATMPRPVHVVERKAEPTNDDEPLAVPVAGAATCAWPKLVADPSPAPAVASKDRRAMTVRLDPVHHMRLRVVSSVLRRSSQEIFVAALEAYFAQLPAATPGNCACLKVRIEASTR